MPVRELNTATKIETAPPPKKAGSIIYHAPRVSGHAGLALRVARGKSGSVRRDLYVITRTPNRREKRIILSNWPLAHGETLASVLARGCHIRERVKKGLTPYPPEVTEVEASVPTLGDIWARYVKTHSADKKPSTVANDDRLWRVHIAPRLADKRPTDLTYDVLKQWYAGVAAKSVVNANRSFKLLKAMLNNAKRKWREPWARENPCEVLGSDDLKPERGRTIVLTREEWTRLVDSIRGHPAPPRQGSAVSATKEPDVHTLRKRQSANCLLLIALTGCRKGEALDACWSEFDLDRGFWNIPATRTKQARTNRIPLSPDAIDHLRALRDTCVGHVLLFPQGDDPQKAQNSLKRSWRTIIKRAGLTAVTNILPSKSIYLGTYCHTSTMRLIGSRKHSRAT